jgi:hypothetical protein
MLLITSRRAIRCYSASIMSNHITSGWIPRPAPAALPFSLSNPYEPRWTAFTLAPSGDMIRGFAFTRSAARPRSLPSQPAYCRGMRTMGDQYKSSSVEPCTRPIRGGSRVRVLMHSTAGWVGGIECGHNDEVANTSTGTGTGTTGRRVVANS